LGVVLLILAGTLGVFRFVHLPAWPGRDRALAPICRAVVEAVKTGNLDSQGIACADNDRGLTILREDDQRLARTSEVQAAVETPATTSQISSQDFIAAIRADLEGRGVVLANVQPLGYGGVKVKVLNPERMREPAVSFTGQVFFLAGESVYGIEFTTRQCSDQYVIMDFWRCGPVDAQPGNLRAFSQEQFRTFQKEMQDPGADMVVKSVRYVFLPLD